MSQQIRFNISIYLKIPYDTFNEDLCDMRDDIAKAISHYNVDLLSIHAGPYSDGTGSVNIKKKEKSDSNSKLFPFSIFKKKIK
jgi:hypothetical protein